ncbi:MAG: hypothetical protein CMJ78_24605 [Planctomycetaceae bacterium]|nr:hypothetical protein [Planctomycetaceae bacterium]
MTRQLLVVCFCLMPTMARAQVSIPPDLTRYLNGACKDCHSGGDAEAGLSFQDLGFDLTNQETARKWILAFDRVTSGEMPPAGESRPSKVVTSAFLKSLSSAIHTAQLRRNDVVLRRLNRIEYQNTVRDLLGVELDANGLPDDTSTDGFDTVGEGLAVSAETMQAYVEVADLVTTLAFGSAKKPRYVKHETNLLKQVDWKGRPQLDSQIGKMFRRTKDGLVIFQSRYCPTNLVNFARLRVPAGTYRGKIRVRAIQSNKPVTLRVYGGDTIVNRRERHLVGYWDIPPNQWTTIEFQDRLVEDSGTFQPKCYGTRDTRKDANTWPEPGLEIGDIVIEGPIDPWPPVSRSILLGNTNVATAGINDARRIIEKLLPRAFRRPVASNESGLYVELFKNAADQGRSFESSLSVALKAILCSPDFLFLNEPGQTQISQHALASRLSYFLWSSMPDEELTRLADQGTLSNKTVLRNQVERMLKSAKAEQFTKNFTGQWLDLRDINFTEPDANLYPEFDELLRLSMVKETQLFFEELLAKDLSIVNFVDSDFTFLNGRLAAHYGIDGVTGQKFRKVQLPRDNVRGGLLTQASILKVTANGTYTSPVLRGVWILENIVGQPTSPPPDNVGSVEPDIRGATTIREQLAKHRNIDACAACHRKIDPPGFALEHFDPIGGYRSHYRTVATTGPRPKFSQAPFTFAWVRYRFGQEVDANTQTPTGEKIANVKQFKRILARDPDQLARNLTRKLLTFGLGRKVGFADRPAVEQIVRQASNSKHGFRSLIHAVVQCPIFQAP